MLPSFESIFRTTFLPVLRKNGRIDYSQPCTPISIQKVTRRQRVNISLRLRFAKPPTLEIRSLGREVGPLSTEHFADRHWAALYAARGREAVGFRRRQNRSQFSAAARPGRPD